MTEEKDFSNLEWYDNRFKAIDVISMQNAIAKVLGELIDTPLRCWISDVNFERGGGGGLHTAKFSVTVNEPLAVYKSQAELAEEAVSTGATA